MTTPLPDAAVEAAAKAFVNLGWQSERQWDSFAPSLRDGFLRQMTAALTAARPHMEAQLQVQAPFGEGLENGVSDGEREGLANVIASAYGDDTSTECPCAQDFTVADALIAAGYRKPTLPSVDIDAAWEAHLPVVAPYHVEPLAKYDANAVARGVAYEKGFRAGATAIKAHLLDGCDRG